MGMGARILIVEDEDAIRKGLRDVLSLQDYIVDTAATGDEGRTAALAGGHELVLLDVMLPGVDGFTICEELRREIPKVSICMLTAKGTEDDILEGFSRGADDYISKPFSVKQLLARVAALLRRSGASPDEAPFTAGILTVDPAQLRAARDGSQVELTRRDIDVLACLADQADQVVSRKDLLQQVWGYGRVDGVETRCVDMHVAKLRKKLRQAFGSEGEAVIETVRGEGYRVAS